VFFTVLAFALVGGGVTQMRVAERSVPPITARLPKHRVVQGPARAYEDSHDAVDELVDRLTTVLDRADRPQRTGRSYAVPSAPVAQFVSPMTGHRSSWFHRRREAPLQYPQLQASRQDLVAQDRADAVSRQVVNSILATTSSVATGRRARSAKADPEFTLPATLAVAALSHGNGAEGLAGAHLYRPSKLYHIYGASVNPVARAKLEKRLRRTHTIHTMRRAGHAVSARRHAEAEPQLFDAAEEEVDPLKPRSLETDALAADLHYDAMEHLENASLEKLPHPVRRKASGEDELGGLIAHIGEGGEAVVDGSAVDDVEHERGPVFDRKGRQRARIAGEATRTEKVHTRVVDAPAKKESPAAKVIRETIDSVDGREAMAKAQVARSADRLDLTTQQKEKVERWLKHTLSEIDLDTGKPKARASAAHAAAEPKEEMPAAHVPTKKAAEPESAPKHEPEHEKKAEPNEEDAPKPHARHKEAAPVPSFEVTHGSTEVDAEAGSDESESPAVKRHKSAAEILKEIRAQKRADDERKAQVSAASASKQAKQEADEIERHVRESVAAEPEMIPMQGHDGAQKPAERAPAPLRHRSEPYENVARDADKLSGDLELTLAPIRDETPVHITELGELPAEHVHVAPPAGGDESIPMVGESSKRVSVSDAVAQVVEVALKTAPPVLDEQDVERNVKPSDIVLGGPSTDLPRAASDESYLNDHERAKVAKRMEEGWNRM
jgi:hypothetical protein